jgi:hypothetical protein
LKQNIKQSEEKGRQLDAEIKRFKQDAANFQSQAQANGPGLGTTNEAARKAA